MGLLYFTVFMILYIILLLLSLSLNLRSHTHLQTKLLISFYISDHICAFFSILLVLYYTLIYLLTKYVSLCIYMTSHIILKDKIQNYDVLQ